MACIHGVHALMHTCPSQPPQGQEYDVTTSSTQYIPVGLARGNFHVTTPQYPLLRVFQRTSTLVHTLILQVPQELGQQATVRAAHGVIVQYATLECKVWSVECIERRAAGWSVEYASCVKHEGA